MAANAPHRSARTAADLRRDLEEQTEELASLVRSTDDSLLIRRPPSGKWSPIEHVDHLIKVNAEYIAALEQALLKGRDQGRTGAGPFKGSVVGRFFERSMEPPVKARVKTLSAMKPDSDLAVEPTLAVFLDLQGRLREVLTQAEGLDLDGIRMRSPFLKLLRAPVFSWFGVILAHNRRHIWLIREGLAS